MISMVKFGQIRAVMPTCIILQRKIRNTVRQHCEGSLTRQQVLSNFRSRGTLKLSINVSPNVVEASWIIASPILRYMSSITNLRKKFLTGEKNPVPTVLLTT